MKTNQRKAIPSNPLLKRKTSKLTLKFIVAIMTIISLSISGCASTSFPVLGIRPDHEGFTPSDDAKTWCTLAQAPNLQCEQYRNYHEYATNLSGSYRSRATLNEWALYFAGLIGFSGLTASA